MVELTRVSYRVGRRWALRDVSLRVSAGELFGLAGPNGGGKSLLLAICATLIRADSGAVLIGGIDARSNPSAVRRLIGYVPEEVGWHPQMTVREDLDFFARAHGLGREAQRSATADAVQRWSLRTLSDVPVRHLSRGEIRRLAIARAWLHGPRVLLLDDPASGLDSESRELLWREVARYVDGGGTVLVATHQPAELARWSPRIGALIAGELRAGTEPGRSSTGSPAAVMASTRAS
jgi:ABC-2 type transport system ATP-binding protein